MNTPPNPFKQLKVKMTPEDSLRVLRERGHEITADNFETTDLSGMSMTPPAHEKTLLCYWYGEPFYEEDVPREKLLEIVKHQAKELEHTRKQHLGDINFLSST